MAFLKRARGAAVLLVAAALAGAVLAAMLGRGERAVPTYRSRSLMVANEWQQRIEGVGRLANAIVETGSFERRLLETDPVAFAGTDVSSTFEVVAVLDTVAVWVQAHGHSAELAERRANSAAKTLAAELNRLGEGTGKFSIQDPASPAQLRTDRQMSTPTRAAIGGFAALLLATGAVLAWPARRMNDPQSVSEELDEGAAGEAEITDVGEVAKVVQASSDEPDVVWIPLPLTALDRESATSSLPDATQSFPWWPAGKLAVAGEQRQGAARLRKPLPEPLVSTNCAETPCVCPRPARTAAANGAVVETRSGPTAPLSLTPRQRARPQPVSEYAGKQG